MTMKKLLFTSFILLILALSSQGQVNLLKWTDNRFYNAATFGKGDDTPTDPSAWLEIGKPGTSRGLLLPRTLTTNITSPAYGLAIVNTLDSSIRYWDGVRWRRVVDSINLVRILASIPSALTFNNGLTKTGNNVQLGGSLVQNTQVDLLSNSLTFAENGNANVAFNQTSTGVNGDIYFTLTKSTIPTFYAGFMEGTNQAQNARGHFLSDNIYINHSGNYAFNINTSRGSGIFFNDNTTTGWLVKLITHVPSGPLNNQIDDSVFTVTADNKILMNTAVNNGFTLNLGGSFRAKDQVKLDYYAGRNDPATQKALYVDSAGNLKYGALDVQAALNCASVPETINFTVGDISAPVSGDTSYTNTELIAKRIVVHREGEFQHNSVSSSYGIVFNQNTGKLTFVPVLNAGERVTIDYYCIPALSGSQAINTESSLTLETEGGSVIIKQ
jgi:hypothetical protein